VHIRVSRVRRKGKTFEYAQLVESYRREDGMPAHRVVHSFGRVEEPLLSNLKAAFQGAKKGQLLRPAEPARSGARRRQPPRPQATLRYLDVAVVLELFRQLGLEQLLGQLQGGANCEVPDHKVIAALVAQRCVAPDSKLAVTRWFPTTALPELLALEPEQLNNTRVHRVLARLEESTPEIMRAVAGLCASQTGGLRTLYLDITDTWFVGRGPEIAAFGKTKEGMVRRKVGIVLLCSEQGYPLRWEVLHGRYAEAPAMLDMLNQLRNVPWIGSGPVICDRAMGRTAYLQGLLATGLPFVTAVATSEMQTYYPSLDELAKPLEALRVTSEEQLKHAQAEASRVMQGTAMKRIDETHFVLDAGKTTLGSQPEPAASTSNSDEPGEALRAALAVTEAVANGRFAAYNDAYRYLGLDPQHHRNLRRLVELPTDLQQRILAGEFAGQSAFRLARIAVLRDEQAQRQAFEASAHRCPRPVSPRSEPEPAAEHSSPLPQVRVVLSFNPEVFASQQLTAHGHLESIRRAIAELNSQLAEPRCKITRKGVERRIEEVLRQKDLLQAFQVDIKTVSVQGKDRMQVELTLDEQNWRLRQRTNGFTVFVTHPDLSQDAEQICKLYRAKDAVETDFRVIKSQLHLRPVRHHTDLKVRAHVTLCMLSLLVERTLRHRLVEAGQSATADRALETFEPLRLCYYAAHSGSDAYVPAEPSTEQTRLLRSLKLLRLADPEQVAAALTPRTPVVSTRSDDSA